MGAIQWRVLIYRGHRKATKTKLAKCGIQSTNGLLKMCATPKGRRAVAADSKLSEKILLGCVNKADLLRVKGVGEEYSDLLERSGVDTVPELAQRNAANLHTKMVEVNSKKKLVRQLPSAGQVEGWVKQAKKLPRAIKY